MDSPFSFDRSFLPEVSFEFVVVFDTHCFRGERDRLPSRLQQSARATLSLLLPGKADVRVDQEVLARALPEQKEEAEVGGYRLAEGWGVHLHARHAQPATGHPGNDGSHSPGLPHRLA